MGMEDDFLLEDEDDEKTIEFIKNYLPQDDGMGPFDPDAIFFVVQGEMEYGNQLGQVE